MYVPAAQGASHLSTLSLLPLLPALPFLPFLRSGGRMESAGATTAIGLQNGHPRKVPPTNMRGPVGGWGQKVAGTIQFHTRPHPIPYPTADNSQERQKGSAGNWGRIAKARRCQPPTGAVVHASKRRAQ